MGQAVIVEAVRTPTGKRGGSLSTVHAVELAAIVLREVTRRAKVDPAEVDLIILGCVSQVGEQGANMARNATLQAEFPVGVPGMTIDFQCGSSQQAVHLAASLIESGAAQVVVAGGVESMSRVPMGSSFVSGPGSPLTPEIMARHDIINQGLAAELIAEHWRITREEMDDIGYRSHVLAAQATREGWFAREIVPVEAIAGDGNPLLVERDEGIRYEPSREKMASLAPAFKADGVVTAGNSSQISDGAAALLLMDERSAARYGLRGRARVLAQSAVGVDPHTMLTGPIPSTRLVLERAALRLGDIDLIEVNEAFASVVAAWAREYRPDMDRVNAQGGAIALGHPLGATGARLMVSLVHALERMDGRYGLQTMCCGGGLGVATVLERL
jgi:acetyl-CoA acyltransferase